MAEVGSVEYKAEVDTSGIGSDIGKTEKQIGDSVKKTEKSTSAAANLIASGYAAKISGAIINAGTDIASFGLQYAMQMEDYTTNFTTLLGNAEKAQELVGNLRDMAAKTPFGTSDLASASQTLLSFGVSAENIMPTIQQLGDVSMGNSERFQSLALAFGQVSSAGKMTGQDLLQFINAGFNPLNVIAQQTGESMEELRKRMSEGGVSAQEVAEAFALATSEGGQFYGAMDNASQTLSGRISSLKDDAAEAAGTLFESLIPAIETVVGWLSSAAQWISKNQQAATIIGGVILGLVATLSILSGVFSIASAAAAIFGVALNSAFLVVIIVIAVIAALVAAIIWLYNNWDSIYQKIQELNQKFNDWLYGLVDGIVQWFKNLWNGLVQWFKDLWNGLVSWCQNTWNSIVNTFKNIWNGITGFFENLWNNILNFFKSIPGKVLQIGKDIVNGLWNGISSGWKWLQNKVSGLVDGLLGGVKKLLGIHSPSTEFAWIGKMSGKGMEEGIDTSFDDVNNLIKLRSAQFLADANVNFMGSLPHMEDYSRSIQLSGAIPRQPQVIEVPVSIDGREVARATAWYMGEQLPWEEM